MRHFRQLRGLAPALLLLLLAAAGALSSCSPKRNNAATRKYQEFITRYNIHYNGDKHFRETLEEMELSYEDDYSRLLPVHPANAKADEKAPQPSGNFDRSIEKAQKAIQLRSIKKKPKKQAGKGNDPKYKAWMKRDEYNPFLHNSWLMMGRSQFLNGDFLGAASTFFYISKHFTWLPETVTEAKLWEARSYAALGWLFEAETILTRVKEDQLVSKKLRELNALAWADFQIHSGDYAGAIPRVAAAAGMASRQQKVRLNFLLGQLYALEGDKAAAYQAYKKAGSSGAATYRTKFNARIKQSEVYSGADITPEVKALRRMTRYDRNKEYLDQIYYAIGNLYLSRADTAKAIENYELAAEKSTRSGIDKALAQLTLGGLYYDLRQYSKAQPCYSEAMPLIPDSYPDYRVLKRRSDVLDELAVYSQNVELQDSLLRLSEMTPEKQLEVVNKIIDELKKKEKEEAEAAAREEFLAQSQGNELQSTNTQNFTMSNGDDSWYFYNTMTKNAGKTEFQRRWGNRKLEDNWRRRNKSSFDFNDFNAASDQEDGEASEDTAAEGAPEGADVPPEDAEKAKRADDPHFPEYYLKQIPKTDEERLTANDIIQEGLYNMGVILKDKMEDFPAAEGEFEELMTRYPDNVYRLDTYYNLYLMYTRAGDTAGAERYRQLILSEFPESKYGLAMRDPDYIGSLRRMEAAEARLYDEALEAYLDNRNREVHAVYKTMSAEYPLSKLMPKFMFLEALACVSDRNQEGFRNTLREMLERYPDTDLTPYASAYLKGLAQGRDLRQGAANMRGMVWDTRLSNDSTAAASDSVPRFEVDAESPQLLVLLYPIDVISSNALLYDIARHNFMSFAVRDFDLEQMNFGRLGLLIIKGFANIREMNHYISVLNENRGFKLPPEVRPVIISQANFDALLRSGGSFDEYFDYMRDKTYSDTEQRVLPPELYEQSEMPVEEPEPESKPESDPSDLSDRSDETEPSAPSDSPGEPESGAAPPVSHEAPEAAPVSIEAPAPWPAPAPSAVPAPEPSTPLPAALPDYPEGSEGDDPLLD